MKTIRFAVVGAKGWRAQFYFRAARTLPESFEICAVYETDPARAAVIAENWGVPIADTWDALRSYAPEFLVVSVRGAAMPGLIAEAVKEGFFVLSETFWPRDVEALEAFYRAVPDRSRVQTAEQYRFQSHHAALLEAIRQGLLGDVGQAQLSVCHGYHAASLMRLYLGVGLAPFTVTGSRMTTPTLQGPGRAGWAEKETIRQDEQDLATVTFDLPNGRRKWALYDWTDESYFSPIRRPRLLLRGDRGEADERSLRRMPDEKSSVELPLLRVAGGAGGDLTPPCVDAVYWGERCLFRHPWPGARLSDEEIAVACVLRDMGSYVRGGKPCYSMEDSCQDQYLALMIREACREGKTLTSGKMPWMA